MSSQQEISSAADDSTRGLFFGDQPQAETGDSDFGRNLAVIIGINDYDRGVPPLRTARHDAERLAEILARQYGYETDLRVEDVTGEALTRLLQKELPAIISEDDRLIFYFAGHGIALGGDDGPAGYLIPQDADAANPKSFLPMQLVHQALTDLPCRHCLILMDCCFSGAFRWNSTRSVITPPEVLHKERYERFVRSPAWQVITSAAYDQEALDTLTGSGFGSRESDEAQEHSPFAQALFAALEGQGDANGDGVLIATELYLYLRDNVEIKASETAGHRQTPGLWPLSKHDKGEFVFKLGEPDLPPAPEPNLENNPYRGLKSFDEEHRDIFCGREAIIHELLPLVARQPLTVVLGASGTGKSSLVKAGVVPPLRQETGPEWHILPILRPSKAPLAELQAVLTGGALPVEAAPAPAPARPAAGRPFWRKVINPFKPAHKTGTVNRLSADGPALISAITTWARQNEGKMLLLVIDQFEELVTLCRHDDERQAFVAVLGAVLSQLPERFRLVITLRSDFEPQLAALMQPHLPVAAAEQPGQYWQNSRYIVPPMSSLELRQAIEEPASKRVLYFEPPSLVDTLIDEVSQTPGALPLLSFTLSEMYIKYVQEYSRGDSDNRALTQKHYDELGGVIGSLRQRADQEYEELTPSKQATMRRVMLRMVVSRAGELARRRVADTELEYANAAENKRVQEVIGHLTGARLVVSDLVDDQTYYEPAHDALVNAWERLRRWLDDAEDTWALQHRLSQAAADWARTADKKDQQSMLWHNDPRLPQLQQALARGGRQLGFFGRLWQAVFPSKKAFEGVTWLNRTESDFARKSIARKGRNLRRSLATTLVVFLLMAILTLLSLGFSMIAEENRVEAETAKDEALQAQATAEAEARISRAGQLAAQSQTVLDHQTTESLLLALESLALVETDPANQIASIQALRQALQRPAGLPFIQGITGTVSSAVSPDFNWLATGSEDGRVQLWSSDNFDAPLRELPGHTAWVNVVAFSPDSSLLATGSDDGTVLVWSLNNLDRDPIRFAQEGWVWDVLFSPDGDWLISGSDAGQVMRWSLASPAAAPELLGQFDTPIRVVGRQADGATLAAGFEEGSTEAKLWLIAGETREIPLPGNELVQGLDISADGQWLALGYEDGTGQIWAVNNLESEPLPLILPDGVTTIQFSPESVWLAIGSTDGTVCIWQVNNLQAAPMILGHGTPINTVTFLEESGLLTASQVDENMRLWTINNLATDPVSLASHTDWIWELAFSPNGDALISSSEDATVRLWPGEIMADPLGGEAQILEDHTFWVTALAVSPDGQWLATGDRDGNLYLRVMSSPQTIAYTFQSAGLSVSTAAISPDSRWLATGHSEGTIKLWSIENPQTTPTKVLTNQEGNIWDLSFSAGGDWLASVDDDGALTLFATANPDKRLVLDTGDRGAAAVEFSGDGRFLAGGGGDGQMYLWKMTGSPDNPVAERVDWAAHQTAVRAIAFSPNGQWLATGSEDDTARMWAMNSFQAAADSLFSPQSVRLKHSKDVLAVAFSPDSRRLATGGGEGLVRLWRTDISDLKEIACQYAARNFTQSEWQTYFPDEPYRQTCPNLPAHPSVTAPD